MNLVSAALKRPVSLIVIFLSLAFRRKQHLNEGKFVVIVWNNSKEIEFAKDTLETHGEHFELNSY